MTEGHGRTLQDDYVKLFADGYAPELHEAQPGMFSAEVHSEGPEPYSTTVVRTGPGSMIEVYSTLRDPSQLFVRVTNTGDEGYTCAVIVLTQPQAEVVADALARGRR